MTRFFARVSARVGQAYTKLFPNTLKKRTWWPVFGVSVLLIAAMSVGIVHGQAAAIESLLNGLVGMIARILIELSKLCIFLTIFFLRAFITLASYNNFIDVSVVKLGWVMVRDVANMFFIVGLLVIAFATILGFESYEWKHGLVKIVLMAILINFSNLIAQLVIDVAHIFTITFLNAVSATAGGNLITMFQMDKILELAQSSPSELGATRDVASLTLFAGSVLAFIFALLAALTIGAYLVVMIFRIVVLWALIVLSPLAFMLYAVPKGEDYAHEWWSEFSKHVIVAPIMVFFLWLAFATLGTGQIISEIQSDPNVIQLNSSGEKQSVTVLEISTWENFASFLLGIGFLWVGIKKTEETGATGAGLVGGALDFTKNVATIATGYAAGRWLVGGAVDKVKSDFPIIGGKSLARKGMMIKGAYDYAKTKVGMKRDMTVQDWEKGLKDAIKSGNKLDILKYGAKRFVLGSIWASSKKKDAVAETWEEKAHMADEEHEARISNSGTWGGTGKDEQRIRTELAVELKQEKGVQKGAEGLLKLMDKEDGQVMTDLDKIAETKALGHDAKALAETRQKKEEAEKVDKLEHGHDETSKKFHKIRKELATLKPIAEQIEQKVAADHHYHEEGRIEELLRPITAAERAAAVGNADLEKDIAEREEYQKYNELATTSEKKLENVKGSNKAQMDLSAAETEAQLARISREFGQRQGVVAESQARMKDIQDKRNAEKEILLLSEIRKLLASGGFTGSIAAQVALEADKGLTEARKEFVTGEERKRFGDVGGFDSMFNAQAVVENQKEEMEIGKMRKVAEERAKVYEDNNDFDRAQAVRQQAENAIFKKQQELNDNRTFSQKRSTAAIGQQRATTLREKWASGTLTTAEQTELDRTLQRNQAALLSNVSAGGELSIATFAQGAQEVGMKSITPKTVQESFLRQYLGIHKKLRKSDGTEYSTGDLTKLFKDELGPDPGGSKYNSIMTRIITAAKSGASKGDMSLLTIARDEIKPDGSLDNHFASEAEQSGSWGESTRKYYSADFSAEAGLLGLAQEKSIGVDGYPGVRLMGEQGNKAIRTMLQGKTSRWFDQKGSARITDQFNDIKFDPTKKTDPEELARFEDSLETIKAIKSALGNTEAFKKSKDAWSGFYSQMKGFATGDAVLEKEYQDALDYIAPSSASAPAAPGSGAGAAAGKKKKSKSP